MAITEIRKDAFDFQREILIGIEILESVNKLKKEEKIVEPERLKQRKLKNIEKKNLSKRTH